jgi:hypothetical protein
MKLNKETLKRIIKEELNNVLDESQLLDRYSKDKEEEFRQYLRDMGKDPDEIIDTLGPAQSDVMRQSLIDNYPSSLPSSATKAYLDGENSAKPVRGGEQILKLLKIMGERKKPSGLHATPTGKVEKRDHGAFGVGYDVEFEWSDGERTYTSLIQLGDDIVFSGGAPGAKGRHTIEQAIPLIDSQEIINYY